MHQASIRRIGPRRSGESCRAGHGPRAQIIEISDEDWHKGIDTAYANSSRRDA